MLSTGYEGEGVGSDGVVQDWTETSGSSGTSTVTYYYHDSVRSTDAHSTIVRLNITDTWSAQLMSGNTYRITVTTVINSITREKIGNPSAYSVSIFARQTPDGANIWTSGGCVDAAIDDTIATNINMGTYYFDLPPESAAGERGTVYYRSNTCGHDGDPTPSEYVDEFWMGINFRNTLPKDYRPGTILDTNVWRSHNRAGGKCHVFNGSSWVELRTVDGPTGMGNPPSINRSDKWYNQRKIGVE